MTFDQPFKRHEFWKDPASSGYPDFAVEHCKPEFYLDLENVTRLMVETVCRYANKKMSVLELGCGTGRNLAGLYKAGFRKLAGVEINQTAVDLGRANFPELAKAKITVAPVEDVIKDLPNYDVIITQGFLMHLPVELTWVIETIREKARFMVLLNEGERLASFHAWPHDYQRLIEAGGSWKQVETHSDEAYEPLPKTTIKRVFLRA